MGDTSQRGTGSEKPADARGAEALRRAGRAEEALALARRVAEADPDDRESRLVMALTLLDLGRWLEARRELEELAPEPAPLDPERLLAREPGDESLTPSTPPHDETTIVGESWLEPMDEQSLDRAFDEAESEPALMWSADAAAEQALRDVPVEPPDEILPQAGSPFATRTFADLLDRQGHAGAARSLRTRIGAAPDAAPAPGDGAGPERGRPGSRSARRQHVAATLERWLSNLRRSTP